MLREQVDRVPEPEPLRRVIFEDAYPEAMPTIPIRRTLYTGRRVLPYYCYRQHEPVQLPGWLQTSRSLRLRPRPVIHGPQ